MNKQELFHCNSQIGQLLKYLLVKTAPVRTGVKPAVLLRPWSCPNHQHVLAADQFCHYQKLLLDQLQLDYRIMRNGHSQEEPATRSSMHLPDGIRQFEQEKILVMFYDRAILVNALSRPAIRDYLRKFGYNCRTPERYLDHLQERFQQSEFPHEVGIFLGYPLKDVQGFVDGNSAGAEVPRGLWRVFGSPVESLRLMEQFRLAEQVAGRIVEEYQTLEVYIKQIKQTIIYGGFNHG